MNTELIKTLLEKKVLVYNRSEFIEEDPICIPHMFTNKKDIEIMGFWAAILAWGQRPTIINKCKELIVSMDNAPYDFIVNHKEQDLTKFLNFKHRTFNSTDALYFIYFFNKYYKEYDSLEDAFVVGLTKEDDTIEKGLIHFHNLFISLPEFPLRTRKHIATPEKGSACKRLNMFLRWMVRKDKFEVDFGIWKRITPSQLICPLDVHVDRTARELGLLKRKKADWKAAVELTNNLKLMDFQDHVKYDFALFGLGLEKFFD